MNIEKIFSNSISNQTFNILKQSSHYEEIVSNISKTFDNTQMSYLNCLSSLDKEKAAYILYRMKCIDTNNNWFYFSSKELYKIDSYYTRLIKIFIDNGIIEKMTLDTDTSYKKIVKYKFLLNPNYNITTISSSKFLKKIINNVFGGNIPIRIKLGLHVIDAHWDLDEDEISNIMNTPVEYEKYLDTTDDKEPSFDKFLMNIRKQTKIIIDWNNSNAFERLKKVIFKHDTDHRFHWPFSYTDKKLRKYVIRNREFFTHNVDMHQSQAVTMSEAIFSIVGDNAWTDMINHDVDLYNGLKKDDIKELISNMNSNEFDVWNKKRKKQKARFFVIPYDDYTSDSKTKYLYKLIMDMFKDNKPFKAIKNITKIKSSKVNELYKTIKDKKKLKDEIKKVTSTRNFNINGHIISTDNDSYLRFSQLNQRFESMNFECIWELLLDMDINFLPLHDGVYISRSTNPMVIKDMMTDITKQFIKNTKFEFNVEEM